MPTVCGRETLSLLSEVWDRRGGWVFVLSKQNEMPNVRDSHGRGFLLPTQDAYTRIETCLSRLPTGVDTAPLTSNPELSNKGLSLDGGFLQLPPPFCYQRDSLSSYRGWLKCDAMKTQHFKYRAVLGTVAANTVNSTLPIDLQSDVSHLHSFICHTARCCSAGSLSYLFKAPVSIMNINSRLACLLSTL